MNHTNNTENNDSSLYQDSEEKDEHINVKYNKREIFALFSGNKKE